MEFDDFRKLSPDEMTAAMKEPIARAIKDRLERQRKTPRVDRFASTFDTTGRWIDRGLKYSLMAEVLSWAASRESWKKTLVDDGFFGISVSKPSIAEASSYGEIFDEQQIERLVIFSEFGAATAFHAYKLWQSALVSSLGPPDITKRTDLGYLALPPSGLLIWNSPIARASLVITDYKDAPVAEFRLRHKLTPDLETQREALIATGNYEKFDL